MRVCLFRAGLQPRASGPSFERPRRKLSRRCRQGPSWRCCDCSKRRSQPRKSRPRTQLDCSSVRADRRSGLSLRLLLLLLLLLLLRILSVQHAADKCHTRRGPMKLKSSSRVNGLHSFMQRCFAELHDLLVCEPLDGAAACYHLCLGICKHACQHRFVVGPRRCLFAFACETQRTSHTVRSNTLYAARSLQTQG